MTDNDRYRMLEQGAENWHISLNDNFDDLSTDVEYRADRDPDPGTEEPVDGAKFLNSESGAVYIGDGTEWRLLGVIGGDGDTGGGGSITGYDGATSLGTFTQLAAGDGLEGSLDGDRFTMDATGITGLVDWQDDGSTQVTASTANFRDNLSVTEGSNGEAIIDAPGPEADIRGSAIRPHSVHQDDTGSPIEGLIVETFQNGNIDHWIGEGVELFDVVDDNSEYGVIAGDYSLHLDHPGDPPDPITIHAGTHAVESRRGETYSCFVRFDKQTGRNQAGLTVCGEWTESAGIVQGYVVRIKEHGELEIMKIADGDIDSHGLDNAVDLQEGHRYRIEVELDWNHTTARVYSESDVLLGTVDWVDEVSDSGDLLMAGGVGIGGRWVDASVLDSSGEAVTFDHITRKTLDATPARISGANNGTSSQTLSADSAVLMDDDDEQELESGPESESVDDGSKSDSFAGLEATNADLSTVRGESVGVSRATDDGSNTPSGHAELCLWVADPDTGTERWRVVGTDHYIDVIN